MPLMSSNYKGGITFDVCLLKYYSGINVTQSVSSVFAAF